MYKRIAVLAVSCFIVLAAKAQLSITGTITDESGAPLIGANVLISNSLIGVSSGNEGRFLVTGLKPGTYQLAVSYMGFEPRVVPVNLSASVTLAIKLIPASILADEIIVRATRAGKNAPVAWSAITKEDIRNSSKIQDIPYLLASTPSVTVTSDAGLGVGYSGIRIRGTDPTRINVTINGVPFNDSESHEVYWVDIPDIMASTENIQVQRGVGTSTQGAASFGANINLQTTSVNSRPNASVSLSGGSFNTSRASVSAGTGLINSHWNVDTRFSRIHTDGFIDRAFADLNSMSVSGGYFSKRNIVKATLLSGYERTYQAWGGVPSELLETQRTYNPYTYENEVDDYKQQHAQLQWSSRLRSDLHLNVSLYYTRGNGYYEQYREGENLSGYLIPPVVIGMDTLNETDLVRRKWLDNRFYGAVYSLNHQGNRLNLTYGGGISNYSGDHFGRVIWSRLASSAAPDHQYYFSNGKKLELNQFVKAEMAVTDRIDLFADLQYRLIRYSINGNDDDLRDISQSHPYNFINPKAGLNFRISNGSRAFISYGMANREPKRSNFTDARPGEVVRPEQLRDLEAGLESGKGALSGSVNLYWMDYTDQLVLTGRINDVGAPVMINIPESYRAGIEFSGTWQPVKSISMQANLTLSTNKIRQFTEYVDDWDTGVQQEFFLGSTDIAFSPSVISAGRITWLALPDLRFSLDSRYVGRQYTDNTSSEERMLDPYWVNNLMISWSLHPKGFTELSLFLQVNNLLNEHYETNAWVYSYIYEGNRGQLDGYFPQAGIHFFAGLTASF